MPSSAPRTSGTSPAESDALDSSHQDAPLDSSVSLSGRVLAGEGRPDGEPSDAVAISDSQVGTGADRLRRSEFDAFERGLLRRRRLVHWPSVALAAAAGLVAFLVTHNREKAGAVELEPNDTPAHATLLPLDKPVAGRRGQAAGHGRAGPGLLPHPAAPRRPAWSPHGWKESPTWIWCWSCSTRRGWPSPRATRMEKAAASGSSRRAVGPGEAFILVRQLWTQDEPLAEDVPDAYQVSAHFGPPQPGWESEPNDTPATANPDWAGNHRMRGYLGRSDDRDWYALGFLKPGTYVASVDAPSGLEVTLAFANDPTSDSMSDPMSEGESPRARAPRRAGSDAARLTFEASPGKPCFVGVARRIRTGRRRETRQVRQTGSANRPQDAGAGWPRRPLRADRRASAQVTAPQVRFFSSRAASFAW